MVWSLSRKNETILTIAIIVVSLTALGVVIGLVILPSVPHEEAVSLKLFTDVEVMRIETYKTLQTNHPISDANKKLSPPCWLSIQFLVTTGTGVASMFTSYLDLPYGTTGQNYTTACAPALAFRNRHQPATFTVLYIDTTDQNNVFFNESTGSSARDWFLTYDSHATPSTIHVTETVGDGIGIGGGFMLTACIVCFLLGVGFAALRCWEDHHPRSGGDADERRLRTDGLTFSPLDEQAVDSVLDEDGHIRRDRRRDSDDDDDEVCEFDRLGLEEVELQTNEEEEQRPHRYRDHDEAEEKRTSRHESALELEPQQLRDEEIMDSMDM